MEKPKKYKAKDMQGNWVTGWYTELHFPHYDNDNPNKMVGYDVVPHLFNDEDGERSNGGWWCSINPDTLQEINEPEINNTLKKGNNMKKISVHKCCHICNNLYDKEKCPLYNVYNTAACCGDSTFDDSAKYRIVCDEFELSKKFNT